MSIGLQITGLCLSIEALRKVIALPFLFGVVLSVNKNQGEKSKTAFFLSTTNFNFKLPFKH